mmetsp:Transcript_1573/g.1382  ORF Transcript_1573/g.1382 Transcript_1573/m.1382 type:complete len:110 (+) Transcript_1573:2-331(+)
MWSLLPHLLKIVVGQQGDTDGGYAFDYFTSMEDYLRCILKYGHEGMLVKKIGEEPVLIVILKSCIRILHLTREEAENTNGYVSIVILETLMVEFKEKLDQLLPTFLKIT